MLSSDQTKPGGRIPSQMVGVRIFLELNFSLQNALNKFRVRNLFIICPDLKYLHFQDILNSRLANVAGKNQQSGKVKGRQGGHTFDGSMMGVWEF